MPYVRQAQLDALARKARAYDALASRIRGRRRARLEAESQPIPVGGLRFTARRRQVLELTCQGLSRMEIAERLGIGEEAVKTHRVKLLRLAGAQNVVELVMWAVRKGMVDPWTDRGSASAATEEATE